MKNYKALLLVGCLTTYSAVAQTVNYGNLTVGERSMLYTAHDLMNLSDGNLTNKGEIYAVGDIVNDAMLSNQGALRAFKNITHKGGNFEYDFTQPSGTLFLLGDAKQYLIVDGDRKDVSFAFNNVVLDNQGGFELSGDAEIAGEVDFVDGIVDYVSQEGATFSFLEKATAINAKDNSFIRGEVRRESYASSTGDFSFPIGKENYYRMAGISQDKYKGGYLAEYIKGDTDFFAAREKLIGIVTAVDTNEYWIVEKEKTQGSSDNIILTLSWNEHTTPKEFIDQAPSKLRIVHYDDIKQGWVDLGGIVDLDNKTVTTPVPVKNYGHFTLGLVNTDHLLDGDVVVYNFVTPNDPSANRYFKILNIDRFSNNTVEIFNRWGVKVYDARNYDPNGDGSTNVFVGKSDGRVTLSKGEGLPTGTYYYVITYEYKDTKGSRMIKKAGYLQLENN